MYGYVYLTTNMTNGRMYIGQHVSRFFDPDYLGSGTSLKEAVRRFGSDSFKVELLEWAQDARKLDFLEVKYIKAANAVECPMHYNMIDTKQPVGNRGNKNFRHTEETRARTSEGVRRAHARIKLSGRSYVSLAGRAERLEKFQETWTEERRRAHGLVIGRINMERAEPRWKNLAEMLKTMSQHEVAAILGVDQSAVAQRIRDHNVIVEHAPEYHEKLLEKRQTAAKLAHAVHRAKGDATFNGFDLAKMYETMTQAEIAAKVGVSQVRVSQRLRQKGISKVGGVVVVAPPA